jgi:hypothetical protein
MNNGPSGEFYDRLRQQLEESAEWPAVYLFKFIVTSDPEKIKELHRIFDLKGAVIESKKSKNGKYTSVSITVRMQGPDEVIAKYREVEGIEGIISL